MKTLEDLWCEGNADEWVPMYDGMAHQYGMWIDGRFISKDQLDYLCTVNEQGHYKPLPMSAFKVRLAEPLPVGED